MIRRPSRFVARNRPLSSVCFSFRSIDSGLRTHAPVPFCGFRPGRLAPPRRPFRAEYAPHAGLRARPCPAAPERSGRSAAPQPPKRKSPFLGIARIRRKHDLCKRNRICLEPSGNRAFPTSRAQSAPQRRPPGRKRPIKPNAMKRIVLLRHGESMWNKENRFTGWTDVDLTPQGAAEAEEAGRLLRDKGFAFGKA